jgi:hypothetical protein
LASICCAGAGIVIVLTSLGETQMGIAIAIAVTSSLMVLASVRPWTEYCPKNTA